MISKPRTLLVQRGSELKNHEHLQVNNYETVPFFNILKNNLTDKLTQQYHCHVEIFVQIYFLNNINL